MEHRLNPMESRLKYGLGSVFDCYLMYFSKQSFGSDARLTLDNTRRNSHESCSGPPKPHGRHQRGWGGGYRGMRGCCGVLRGLWPPPGARRRRRLADNERSNEIRNKTSKTHDNSQQQENEAGNDRNCARRAYARGWRRT